MKSVFPVRERAKRSEWVSGEKMNSRSGRVFFSFLFLRAGGRVGVIGNGL